MALLSPSEGGGPSALSGARLSTLAIYILPFAALALGLALRTQPGLIAAGLPAPLVILCVALLVGAAFSTMSHSDVVAAKLGQPFGTLVLTLSVTVIEVSVIASIMLYKENNPTLARESVFSVIMIVLTGIVGLCLFLGSLKHREQDLQQQGTAGYFSVIVALGVIFLILPDTTHEARSGQFTHAQLGFVALVAIGLYGAFLYMQTVRYRDHFVPEGEEVEEEAVPGLKGFLVALVLLLASLAGVVSLSSYVAAGVEDFLQPLGLIQPDAVTGALVAALLLMPEGISAVRAAWRNQLQLSLNIALGSALATIALTIPAMAFISVVIERPIVLGLDAEGRTLMLLTLVLSVLSFGTGKTNVLTGLVHLIVFFVYVMLLFAP